MLLVNDPFMRGGIYQPDTEAAAPFSVSIGSGPFETGATLTATVNGLQGGEVVAVQWTDDGTDIPGATSINYLAEIGTDGIEDMSLIRCVATVDGTPYPSGARMIRYPNVAAPSIGAQAWQTGNAVSLDASAGGTGLVWSYAMSGATNGVGINPGTGQVTGTPTADGSGAAQVTATNQYGEILVYTFGWVVTTASLAISGFDLTGNSIAITLTGSPTAILHVARHTLGTTLSDAEIAAGTDPDIIQKETIVILGAGTYSIPLNTGNDGDQEVSVVAQTTIFSNVLTDTYNITVPVVSATPRAIVFGTGDDGGGLVVQSMPAMTLPITVGMFLQYNPTVSSSSIFHTLFGSFNGNDQMFVRSSDDQARFRAGNASTYNVGNAFDENETAYLRVTFEADGDVIVEIDREDGSEFFGTSAKNALLDLTQGGDFFIGQSNSQNRDWPGWIFDLIVIEGAYTSEQLSLNKGAGGTGFFRKDFTWPANTEGVRLLGTDTGNVGLDVSGNGNNAVQIAGTSTAVTLDGAPIPPEEVV